MMKNFPEGNAIVYCQDAFNTPNGKTAHGLVRKTARYSVLSVVDSTYAGKDAGLVLDGAPKNIPIIGDVAEAVEHAARQQRRATHLVIGLAPDGGRLNPRARQDVKRAIELGLNVDCGLHDFLSDDPEISGLAVKHRITLRDVRKTPTRDKLHFFDGRIEQVTSLKIAVLGTDSAIGKRTTAWILVEGFRAAGYTAEMVGTGQTAWMQGAQYSLILDSLINDFVSGEIEFAVWSAWNDKKPDVIVIEGQGSLMNPAYPGGYEILAAARPDVVVLQHAPARVDYDGFPGYRIHPLDRQIKAIEIISEKPVVAITINHESLQPDDLAPIYAEIEKAAGCVASDVLVDGPRKVIAALETYLKK
ncbi:MAG: DUF1611 domain-containing protein [Candidatus Zhuqueibacterota bacterium]